MEMTISTFDDVALVVARTLDIENRLHTLSPSTPMLDAIPELDSHAVIEVILALESRFDIAFDIDEITGDAFENLGSLADLVEQKVKRGR